MPIVLTEGLEVAIPPDIPRKRWTRAEVEQLADVGLDVSRLELIDGELIQRMGKKSQHIFWHNVLEDWARKAFGSDFCQKEDPINVSPEDDPTSEPEPDLAILSRPRLSYRAKRPGSADIRLLIEISDTTLYVDLKLKAGLYARAGMVEYWVLDIPGQRLIVHRQPEGGVYQDIVAYRNGEKVAPLAAPDADFLLDWGTEAEQ